MLGRNQAFQVIMDSLIAARGWLPRPSLDRADAYVMTASVWLQESILLGPAEQNPIATLRFLSVTMNALTYWSPVAKPRVFC